MICRKNNDDDGALVGGNNDLLSGKDKEVLHLRLEITTLLQIIESLSNVLLEFIDGSVSFLLDFFAVGQSHS